MVGGISITYVCAFKPNLGPILRTQLSIDVHGCLCAFRGSDIHVLRVFRSVPGDEDIWTTGPLIASDTDRAFGRQCAPDRGWQLGSLDITGTEKQRGTRDGCTILEHDSLQ